MEQGRARIGMTRHRPKLHCRMPVNRVGGSQSVIVGVGVVDVVNSTHGEHHPIDYTVAKSTAMAYL